MNVDEHAIDLKDGAKLFKSAPYRSSRTASDLQLFEPKKQLEPRVVEPVVSKGASPVLFVLKMDGQLCFCKDYRKLNEMKLKHSYLLSRMDDCIESFGESKAFSTLNAYSGCCR